MIKIRNNNVIIPLTIWNELKKDDYIMEKIEILEDSGLLEKTKRESTGFIDFYEYVREREEKEKANSKAKQKNLKKNKASG